jgi:hypothetical protein
MDPEKYEPFAEIELIELPLYDGPKSFRTKSLEGKRIKSFNWIESFSIPLKVDLNLPSRDK